MGDKNILLWAILFSIFACCAWWHVRENRRLTRKWQSDLDEATAKQLVRFAWVRTAQLLYAIACASAVILVYDWQLAESQQAVKTVPVPEAAHQEPAKTIPAKVQPKPLQAKPKPAALPVSNSYYPPLVAQPAPARIQAPPPAAAKAAPATVDDVYNPEKKSGGNEAAMDGIKKRYEDILVTYLFLKKCGRASDNDYSVIAAAMDREIAAAGAPARLPSDIIASAQGSYNEMYAKSSCDGEEVGTLSEQYTTYVKALSDNLPKQ